MGESVITTLSMENHHHHHHNPSTLLSMDPTGAQSSASSHDEADRDVITIQRQQQQQSIVFSQAPDINLPLSAERSPPPPPWNQFDACEIGDYGLGSQIYENEAFANVPRVGAVGRKCAKRGDSIWGAWFFFNFYFKPVLSDKSKCKIARDGKGVVSGFDKSDLCLDVFLVQHDMENMYMWVFKERPENSLGKMQLRSFMNGHSRLGEPQFPFSVEKGFVRSHRMQRKHYRGLSNPQCVHGIEVVRSPSLTIVSETLRKKWMEITGREINFSIPPEACDFSSWRNLPNFEFELERPIAPPPPLSKNNSHPQHPRRLLNGTTTSLNLGTQASNHAASDGIDLSPVCTKRRKVSFSHGIDEDCSLPASSLPDHEQDIEMHSAASPSWLKEFTGVMKHTYGPVTAAKTIYEDEQGYLIIMSLPLCDMQRVKVSWRNTLTHGIVKILCISNARMSQIKRHDRTFRLTDKCSEHCPPGEFIREIPLATRIPEDAKLEAYCDESGTVLEIMVPKLREGPEEHEVRVCMRPLLGPSDLLLNDKVDHKL